MWRFILGFFLGANFGFVMMALFCASKDKRDGI